ncbi:RodZ domain-containing protein [Deinococcus sp.]|uniref:RodZ domain-containing protein n=1 Tax=Deinococcus sp. TaxID=47478 RepID=UPI00286E9223|nr:RodZ domain-containing protein [Deinococcus sp.]
MSFGDELKAAREALSLSIQDVAGRIKIRGDYLRALEAEDLKVLPERTFTRAYLQTYARELGLDALPLLRDFDRLLPQPPEQVNNLRRPDVQKNAAASGRRTSGLLGGLLGGLLLLGVAGYFGYSAYLSRSTPSASAQQNPVALPSTRQVKFSLSSTPAGARVYVDNRYLGLTPVQGFPLDARAQAALRVEYGGRQSYLSGLNLEADRSLNIDLTPLTEAQLAAQVQAAQAQAIQAQAAQRGTTAPAPEVAQSAPTPPVPQSGTATSGMAAPAPAPASGVRLTWAGQSWTRVTAAGGAVLYQGIPAAGSSRDFPAGITVRTGSAGLVTATPSGGQPQKLGAVGQVVTRTF